MINQRIIANAFLSLLGAFCLVSCTNTEQNSSLNHKASADTVLKDTTRKRNFIRALAADTAGINFTDLSGKKQGRWIVRGKMAQLPGYDSNAKVEEGLYRNSKKEGEWTEYNADGSVKSRVMYKDGVPVK